MTESLEELNKSDCERVTYDNPNNPPNALRTHNCAALRASDEGKRVTLSGWVHRIRALGGLTFILLRDRFGMTQVRVGAESSATLKDIASSLKSEYCITVTGFVRLREEKDFNKDLATGEIELDLDSITILSTSAPLPFQIDEVRQKDGSLTTINEDTRLRFRYLDLRRERMKNNIVLRSAVTFAAQEFLTKSGFLQIETPTFIKSTPEGARDFLVPSRLWPGKFYSLPQSPQLYKQLLMVSGFDRYFQIARCYRDEDPRGDRQVEFTQIDMELSFTNREEVLSITEQLMEHIFSYSMGLKIKVPFERLSWMEAFELYGTDKPDLRFDLKIQDASFMANFSDFQPFKAGAKSSDPTLPRHKRSALKVLVVPSSSDKLSRKKIESLEEIAKRYKAKGLAWIKVAESNPSPSFSGGVSKYFSGHESEICERLNAKPGDTLLFVSDEKWDVAVRALGAVRKQLGSDLALIDPNDKFHFVWIVDFPYFAWNEDEKKWETEHHMFTLPKKEYWDGVTTLEDDPASVTGDLYDLVLNGYELASGSMRINNPELQERIFKIVGYTKERADAAFGFLVEAFKYGAPPHGGIAPGLDRLVMLMAGEESIHEVIAFPKNNAGISPMDSCPSSVDDGQLKELHLAVKD